ncbi:hypothetical protein FDA33_01035 [Clostridium botulinum]|nr:hypothetical protein [Clostridium botulinum]NFI16769.1 hypothetical protein [Clostridium botulinum]NFN50309.1 hypothetical protein [Clostridium botulinum]NFO25911.1 hypothetical protein [Clostridium botulinum]NFO59108.1 hypothetical protein [Clostridium botulinum]
MEKEKNKDFIMLPNILVWQSDKEGSKDDTYIHIYGEKICMILSYLDGCVNRYGYCYFTFEQMIKFCGMKVDKHKGKSLDQFKSIIKGLIDNNIITSVTIDIDKVKSTEMIISKLHIPIQVDKDNKNTSFFTIDRKAFINIVTVENDLNKVTLLKIYYYIVSRIRKRREEAGSIEVCGGKSETFYDNYVKICDDLEISEDTFKKYLDCLKQMKLIFSDYIGLVTKNEIKNNANNVYCKEKKYLEYALKESRAWYIDNGYKVLDKKVSTTTRQLSGAESRLKQLKQQGKDTTKLEKKIIELKDIIFDKNTICKADLLKEINEKHQYLIDKNANRYIDIYENIEDYFPDETDYNVHNLSVGDCKEILKTINDKLVEYKKVKHKTEGIGVPNPFEEYEDIVKNTEKDIESYYDTNEYIYNLL